MVGGWVDGWLAGDGEGRSLEEENDYDKKGRDPIVAAEGYG